MYVVGFEEDGYRSISCNSYDCPAKNDQIPKQDSWDSNQTYKESQAPRNGQANNGACNCNCHDFETKDKLASLIAKALEIFISSNQCKNDEVKDEEQNQKGGKVKNPEKKVKKPKKRGKRSKSVEPAVNSSTKSAANVKGESPFRTAKSSKAKLSAISTPFSKVNSIDSTLLKVTKSPISKNSSLYGDSNADTVSAGSRNKDRNEKPPFFLPDCEEHRCKNDCKGICSRKPHDCGRGCKSVCQGPCSKSGGGDGQSRSRASKNKQQQQRHARCQQCNQGEGRQWQEVGGTTDCPDGTNAGGACAPPGCSGCGGGQDRSKGGGKDRNTAGGKNTLLGLSPIAHYRPGMLQFPVNYLLAGTNFRRSLVRTAAGVTLHQKPYVDMADAKDLPNFPCRKKGGSADYETPAKKWL